MKPDTASIDTKDFSAPVNAAVNQKWIALAKMEAELVDLETSFDDEEKFITFFTRKNDQADVVVLNVCGTHMTTTRRTLQLNKDSKLASEILNHHREENISNQKPVEEWNAEDVVAWLNTIDGLSSSVIKSFEEDEVTGRELLRLGKDGLKDFGITKRGTIFHLISEIEKRKRSRGEAVILIEHSPYCIEKILDHLRLESAFVQSLTNTKPGLPRVCESEKSSLKRL